MSDELEKRVSKLEDRHEELQMQFLSLATQFAEVKAITSRTETYYHDMMPRIRGIETVIGDLRVERTSCANECSKEMVQIQQRAVDALTATKKELRADIDAILPIVKAVKFSAIFVVVSLMTLLLSADFHTIFRTASSLLNF